MERMGFKRIYERPGVLDTTTRGGLYWTAREQGYGRLISAAFAWRQHRQDGKR